MIISSIDIMWTICRYCFSPNSHRWQMQIYPTNGIASGNSRVCSHCIWDGSEYVWKHKKKSIKHLLGGFLTCPIYLIFIASPFFSSGCSRIFWGLEITMRLVVLAAECQLFFCCAFFWLTKSFFFSLYIGA